MTCSSDISNEVRYALDIAYEQVAKLGLHPYKITAIIITNIDGYRPGVGGTKLVTQQILTVGPDGYDTTDGYHNPNFRMVSAKDIMLSGARLTDQDYCLGPLVFPYIACNGSSGGTDPILLNPIPTLPKSNLQLYFKVEGPGMAPNGSYFKRKYSKEDSNLSYRVFLTQTGEVPSLT